MSYKILNHTAKEINQKLDQLEVKNLLPYPYTFTELPDGLEDLGDGSILITDIYKNENKLEIPLCQSISLPTDILTYTASFEVTNAENQPVYTGITLKIQVCKVSEVDGVKLDAISEYTSEYTIETAQEIGVAADMLVTVSLVIPTWVASTTEELLIKPQIEAGPSRTSWAPPQILKIGNIISKHFNKAITANKEVLDKAYAYTDQKVSNINIENILKNNLKLEYSDNKLYLTFNGERIGEDISIPVTLI